MRVYRENSRVIIASGTRQLWIDPWGENSFRVRMTATPAMDGNDWALTEPVPQTDIRFESAEIDVTDPWYKGAEYAQYHQTATEYRVTNGALTVQITHEGWLRFLNSHGEVLTEEYWRNRDRINRYCVPLRVEARELKPIIGTSDFSLAARFEAYDGEMIFGMGQYQDGRLDKKGCSLEQSGERAVLHFLARVRLFVEQSRCRHGGFC